MQTPRWGVQPIPSEAFFLPAFIFLFHYNNVCFKTTVMKKSYNINSSTTDDFSVETTPPLLSGITGLNRYGNTRP